VSGQSSAVSGPVLLSLGGSDSIWSAPTTSGEVLARILFIGLPVMMEDASLQPSCRNYNH